MQSLSRRTVFHIIENVSTLFYLWKTSNKGYIFTTRIGILFLFKLPGGLFGSVGFGVGFGFGFGFLPLDVTPMMQTESVRTTIRLFMVVRMDEFC